MHKNIPKRTFSITTETAKFDALLIHDFLTHTYWAKDVSLERIKKQFDTSLCFGIFADTQQIGFARVISDFESFAYLTDVFMVAEYRGIGLGKHLMKVILQYPSLQNLRRWIVKTKDTHSFFAKAGFLPLSNPTQWLEIYNPKTKKLYDKQEVFALKTDKLTMKLAFKITNNTAAFNPFTVHQFLTNSYWAKGISLERVKNRIENTLCFGILADEEQVGFARIITDFDSFAYLADVFILEGYRGIGLSKRLIDVIMEYPPLKNVQSWLLATRDAHGLYEKFGFEPLKNELHWMEIVKDGF